MPDYEGLYEVSDLGRVRTLERDVVTTAGNGGGLRVNRRKAKILKPTLRKGYSCVSLARDGRQVATRINRIVLLAFQGPPVGDRRFALHRDGNQSHNQLSNLYWGTSQDNADDAKRHGTVLRGENHPEGKLREADVRRIRAMIEQGTPQTVIAAKYGVTQGMIAAIKARRTWRHVI